MIDKTKSYRFKGDSERWVWRGDLFGCGQLFMNGNTAEHLHSRGILLEYPELPGDDWEFCEAKDQEMWWEAGWRKSYDKYESEDGIYCRKKKPVYRSGKVEPGEHVGLLCDGRTVYWTTDPEKGKELLK